MGIVDFILNLAALLLWINWRLLKTSPATGAPTTLLGTLRPAEPSRWGRWYVLASLPALLALRAWIYWEIASASAWVPRLDLGVLTPAFRCEVFQRAFAYSTLSFLWILALFYLWLLLLSILGGKPSQPTSFDRFVRIMLGPVAKLPPWLKLILPMAMSMLAWLPLSELFVRLGLQPEPDSLMHRLEQGLLLGLAATLTWSHLLAGLLLLYVVLSYVHLGDHPFWEYAHSLARNFLVPFRKLPLQFGKVDFAPLAALGLVYLLARVGAQVLWSVYRSLPF